MQHFCTWLGDSICVLAMELVHIIQRNPPVSKKCENHFLVVKIFLILFVLYLFRTTKVKTLKTRSLHGSWGPKQLLTQSFPHTLRPMHLRVISHSGLLRNNSSYCCCIGLISHPTQSKGILYSLPSQLNMSQKVRF